MQLGPAAGVAVVGIALGSAVLVPLGWWHPATAIPLALAVSALSGWVLPRIHHNPSVGAGIESPGGVLVNSGGSPAWLDRHSGWISAGLASVFTLWTAFTHAEHVVLRRDPGAYALYTHWIATRQGLPVSADLVAFGGPAAYGVPGFTLDSPAYYQVLHGAGAATQADVVPQFLVGAPAVFSFGWWAGALADRPWLGLQLMPALVGGLALMAFAALAARLIGARWAPFAMLLLGSSLPVVLASRSTYSEPAALLVLLSGTCLAVDALAAGNRRLALLAGAVLGLAGLIRIDAVREVALLVAVCALLAIRGNRVAVPLAGGALAGTAISIVVWVGMSRPYLNSVSSSLLPLLAATAAVVLMSAVAVPVARRRPAAARPPGRWAALATAGVVAAGLLLASRPLWLVVRQDPDSPTARFVATLQRGQNLPVDPGRMYAEHSLTWVAWYLGWPLVVLAWVVLAVLAGRAMAWWRCAATDPPVWLLPAAAGFASALLVLYRPGITPDHPWADRRLVPVVLPLTVLAATAGLAWAVAHRPTRVPAPALVTLGLALTLGPIVWASGPLVTLRTEGGEVDAVAQVCSTLRPGDVIAAVDATPDGHGQRSANEWVQVIRGICGHPSAALLTPAAELPAAAALLSGLVEAAGGRLVLLTAQEDGVAAQRVLGLATGAAEPRGFGPPTRAVRLETIEDRKLLTRRPPNGARLVIEVWTAQAR